MRNRHRSPQSLSKNYFVLNALCGMIADSEIGARTPDLSSISSLRMMKNRWIGILFR